MIDETWLDPAAIQRALRDAGLSRFSKVPGFMPTHDDVLAAR